MMGGCFHLESLPWKRSANYIAKISIYYYDCITSLTYFNTPEVSHERKTESDSPFADSLPLHPRRGICLRRTIFAIWIQRLALPPKRQLCRNHLSEKDASCAYRGSHAGTYCDARANRDAHAGTDPDARANRDALLMAEDAETALTEVQGGYVGAGYLTSCIVLMHENQEQLQDWARDLRRTV